MAMEWYGDERDFEPGGIHYDGPVDVLEDEEEEAYDDRPEED